MIEISRTTQPILSVSCRYDPKYGLPRHSGIRVSTIWAKPAHYLPLPVLPARSAQLTMTLLTRPLTAGPPVPETDLKTVIESRNREWHFHIYFLTQSPVETAAALALRDAVLRLRRDGKKVVLCLPGWGCSFFPFLLGWLICICYFVGG